MGPPLFEERQYLPAWLRFLATGLPVIAIVPVLVGLKADEGRSGALILLLILASTGFVAFMRFSTVVQPGRIIVHWWPFPARTLLTSEIETFEARRYSPLREYGGWGIKGTRKNRAYNAQGNLGVQLVMKSGERVLIGSQRPDDLVSALEIARQMQD